MPRKPIHALINKQPKAANNQAPTDAIRSLVTQVQQNLKDRRFEQALKQGREIEQLLKDDARNAAIYLTSMFWQVRAMQGLAKNRSEIEPIARHCAEEAARLGDIPRQIQALRMTAQLQIEDGEWPQAIETLQNTLDLAITGPDTRTSLELLMHLSSLESKCSHHIEAIDYLSRAMGAIDGACLPQSEAVEIKAMGYRSLFELYRNAGEGQMACDALESAQEMHCQDPEEQWLQTLYLSQLAAQSGKADEAAMHLHNVQTAVAKLPNARREQIDMIQLECAQNAWMMGRYDEARDLLNHIHPQPNAVPLRLAIALTRFQWAVETGKPADDPDAAAIAFQSIERPDPSVNVELQLAAALTQIALDCQRGNMENALESLDYVAETATFTQRIPFVTRTHLMRADILFNRAEYDKAAIEAHAACDGFVHHLDDVSAKIAAAMMLRAQYEQSCADACGDTIQLDAAEQAAFNQLYNDMMRYRDHQHIGGFLDLGLQLAQLSLRAGLGDRLVQILQIIKNDIEPQNMAWRTMKYEKLCAAAYKDEKHDENAKQIAIANGFVTC